MKTTKRITKWAIILAAPICLILLGIYSDTQRGISIHDSLTSIFSGFFIGIVILSLLFAVVALVIWAFD